MWIHATTDKEVEEVVRSVVAWQLEQSYVVVSRISDVS